jgi:hypothetical protein
MTDSANYDRMKTAKMTPSDENAKASSNHPFRTVIVSEDYETEQRVEQIYQRLLKEFSGETDFKCLRVRFNSLAIPEVLKDAAKAAAKADLVIFSTHAERELPEHVRLWIERWLPEKSLEDSALAALVGLPGEESGVTHIHEYLSSVARRGKMEFFSRVVTGIDRVQTFTAPTAYQHWGINE